MTDADFEIQVEAPGKLYLFGEYGVLAGGWAVVAAVDRRVRAGRRSAPSSYRVQGGDGRETALVEAVMAAVEDETGRGRSPDQFATDVSALYEGGESLGLGSSAASCVALTAAAMVDSPAEVEEGETRNAIFAVAERAHRDFQGGRGSGGGIVASTFGGVNGLRRREPTPMFADQRIEVGDGDVAADRALSAFELATPTLPTAVAIRPVWLGAKASTTSFLGTVERMLQLKPAEVYQRLRRTAEAARDAVAACRDDDADSLLEAAAAGEAAMEALGETLEVPIVTEEHVRLREATDGLGVTVKPSGAGGGDFSLVFGTEETDWQAVEAALPSGVRMMEMAFGVEGARGV